MAVGATGAWLAGPNTVTRVDLRTGQGTSTPQLGQRPGETASVALGASGVWFVSSASATLWRIDATTATPSGTVPVGTGPDGVAVGDGHVWVANSADGTVTRLDAGQNPRSVTIPLGTAPGGIVAAYGLVWVAPGLRYGSASVG
jgi:hypothetical protein